MHAKTMEGLIGAKVNITMTATPMRVYKEARRREDKATMERALGYAGQFTDYAGAYQKKVEEGMKEDAEAVKEERLEREKAIENRREDKEKQKKGVEENREDRKDGSKIQEINNEGKASIEKGRTAGYTKTGESLSITQEANISVIV